MSEFTTLRKRARDRRDKAISEAEVEYEKTLVTIAALEQDLLGNKPQRKLRDAVESVLPLDRPFTVADVSIALQAMYPGRCSQGTVYNHIKALRQRGAIRRIKKGRAGQSALYVREGANIESLPCEDMSLREVVSAALSRPMTLTEITVAVREAGYDTSMGPKMLRKAILAVLREGGYRESYGKWSWE